ncbi:MAG TPA: 2TM domain-containing protein [Noviherbaspirillum sp.]|uniref:2TM domain-containing protein n=1 Tax=Noviherbaspirillum sp. TaxID=1926288 RepID=UPI002DDCF27F|nr:2TM domain-containing protein [Noviherbaspirillum sp.]HEV2608727.1 2TM domain-containing protein [Noviherbaspirillum sp.]
MDTSIKYQDAKRVVERKLGFYTHLSVYVIVNTGLIALNIAQDSGRPFAIFPLLGWGIGLLFHGLAVFLHGPKAAWKRRMIDKEMKRQLDALPE